MANRVADNSEKTTKGSIKPKFRGKCAPRGKPFAKGKSGNPNGRPKEDPELKALCRAKTEVAVHKLIWWMESDNPKASVAAAKEILDRGWGRASQDIKLGAELPIKIEIVRFGDDR